MWRERFRYLRRRPREIDDEIEAELREHLERRIEALVRSGLSPDEARREALLRFGDLERTRRYCRVQQVEREREMHRRLAIGDVIQDVKIAVRGLLRAPVL